MIDPFAAFDNSVRLIRAARVLARHDALFPFTDLPAPPLTLRMARWLARLRLPWEARAAAADTRRPGERLAEALQDLGPSYIKLGQMLATRPDVIGDRLAADLMRLQDRLAAFPQALAEASITEELGGALSDHFISLGPAIAAASIAQVHQAMVAERTDTDDSPAVKQVAVKILRPGVEEAFTRDLDSFLWAAQLIERAQPGLHRLHLTEVVRILAESVALEMDLRYEAAAASELAENMAAEIAAGEFRVPAIDWRRTARQLDCHIRGLTPAPGAWFSAPQNGGDIRIKILRASPVAGAGPAGTVLDDQLTIACGAGALRILQVQREGKAPSDAASFLRGFALPAGLLLD